METKSLTELSIQELNDKANASPRFLSIACSQMALAKTEIAKARLAYSKGFESIALEHQAAAKLHLAASERAWKRSQEDEAGQLLRVRQVAAVVEERGAALEVNKKVVSSNRNFATSFTWQDSWGTK